MQKETTDMSMILLVKPKNHAMLFRVSTFADVPFKVWKDLDQDGISLFWKGRRVEKVYSSMSESGDHWWSVPVSNAARSLLMLGKAKRVKAMPKPEGELL